MSKDLDVAKALFFEPTGLEMNQLESTLGSMMSHGGIDAADLYFQHTRYESWSLEDSRVKDGSFGIDKGVGVRAISGEKTGFAYSDDISLSALEKSAQTVQAISRQGQEKSILVPSGLVQGNQLYAPIDPLGSLNEKDKIQLLESLDKEARRLDPRIKQVMVGLAATHDVILVAASDGTLATDVRPLVRLSVSVIAEQDGRREIGSSGGGGRVPYSYFLEEERGLSYAREAVRQALVNLE
ncbi:MAG: metalloprotease TldD, partial [Gammaproteobacteria bacterium]|nr:metalloprotease TldD [Gammaproteobacteria bacterium]